jgi:general secretion pathway protein H
MTRGENPMSITHRVSTDLMISFRMAPTDKRGALVPMPMSPAGPNEPASPRGDDRRQAGFTLLEVVCVMAILAIVAAITVPALPRGTSRARLQSYALATAALLKADHNAAIRRHTQIATEVDAPSRFIRSGATERAVRIPDDVLFDTLLAARCNEHPSGSTIRFFSSGMSCGGVIKLTRLGFGYEIRVNWLTGGVDIVALDIS